MHIIVLGAGYGGLICALRLARKTRGHARVTLVNAGDRFVQRVRLHQLAAGQRLAAPRLARMVRNTGIDLKIGRATAIDLVAQTLTVGDEALAWDRLVVALGSSTDTTTIPGVREHAFSLDPGRSAELGERASKLAQAGGRVLVVGGGLTGIEGATELAEAFPSLQVSLITRGPILAGWSAAARAHTLATLARLRVDTREGVETRMIDAGRLQTDQGPIGFDLCLWSVGFAFASLPREAGLAVTERGQVRVDPWLRSVSHPNVYAVGDIARPDLPPGQELPLGCKSALPTGAYVADSIAAELRGRPTEPFDIATPLYCVSLGRRDALIQIVDDRGDATGPILRGRLAVAVKELICRGTLWTLQLERRGPSIVAWKQTGRAPALAMPSRA